MKATVYIDESGTLPDVKDRVIVVAAVGTPLPHLLDRLLYQAQKHHQSVKPLSEVKITINWPEAKRRFLKEKLV